MTETKRPLKVFLCHAHGDRDAVKALYSRLTTLAPDASAGEDGVDRCARLDKERLLPGRGFDKLGMTAQPTRLGIGDSQSGAPECIICL